MSIDQLMVHASESGDAKAVELMLSRGARTDYNGSKALKGAIKRGARVEEWKFSKVSSMLSVFK